MLTLGHGGCAACHGAPYFRGGKPTPARLLYWGNQRSGNIGTTSFRPPLQVALLLLPPEVVVTPSSAEVGRQLGRLLRNVVESSKPFVRWMDGTCIEAPEQ